jgi:DNA mismatch endonuclease Vsr
MSRIRARGTGPERALAAALAGSGLAFSMNDGSLPGSPDLVFEGGRLAVFVNGCFWHGCPRHYRRPGASCAQKDVMADPGRAAAMVAARATRCGG